MSQRKRRPDVKPGKKAGKKPGPQREHVLPEGIDAFIESVMDLDRRWFEDHPTETEYTRMYHPGECWPLLFPLETSVTVTQIRPGIRQRATNRPPLNPGAMDPNKGL